MRAREAHAARCIALSCAVAIMLLAARQSQGTAAVRTVRYTTTPDVTRLIIECSAPLHYRLQRVAARADLGVPARIYVDFFESELTPEARAGLALAEGPLLRVRAGKPNPTTSRLILDVPGLTELGAFPMPDPFRLIIDVRGTRRERPAVPDARHEPADRAAAPAPASPDVTAAHGARALSPPVHASAPPRPASPRFKVVIDPGHGGKDPGAIGVGGQAEKDVTLAVALRLRQRLAAVPRVDAVLTRDSDVYLALEERTARANTERADLFVSIHTNASPNPNLAGVETYYLNNTSDRATIRLAKMENGLASMTGHGNRDMDTALILSDLIQSYKVQESAELAEHVQRALVAALNTHGQPVSDLGVKRGPFYVLVGAGMPCILAEVSFLTNPREGARLAERPYQDAVADGLLRGIMQFVDNSDVAKNL
ncbi:MAG: N-acetylmuramoyl-L-alanine amidase [Candidatus Binatia bacterium]